MIEQDTVAPHAIRVLFVSLINYRINQCRLRLIGTADIRVVGSPGRSYSIAKVRWRINDGGTVLPSFTPAPNNAGFATRTT